MANGVYCYKIFSENERKVWTEEEIKKAKPIECYITEFDIQHRNEELAKKIQKASSPDAPEGYLGWEGSAPEGFVYNSELSNNSNEK